MARIRISDMTAGPLPLPTTALLEASVVNGAAPTGYETQRYTVGNLLSLFSAPSWDNITDKPPTFPPTLPIAQADVTNLVADLAATAPLASPALTGTPSAPTPATADSSTRVATTAFVKAQAAGVAVSDTAPSSPTQGALWFDSTAAQLFVQYQDGTSNQWLIANNQSAASLASGGTITGTLNVVGAAAAASVKITGGPSYATVLTLASSPAAGQVDVRYEGPRTWVSGVQAASGSYFFYDATVGQYRVMFDSAGATLNGSGSWG